MRNAAVQFSIQYPTRKYRHEKPDIKTLLERKESSYVDVAAAPRWHLCFGSLTQPGLQVAKCEALL